MWLKGAGRVWGRGYTAAVQYFINHVCAQEQNRPYSSFYTPSSLPPSHACA